MMEPGIFRPLTQSLLSQGDHYMLLETNPPRNSQPETHRDDGPGNRLRSVPRQSRTHIGLKDLRMPEKTHSRSLRSCCGTCRLLKLLRWLIAQGRMQPETIVVLFDERLDVGAQVIEIAILVGVNFRGSSAYSLARARRFESRTGGAFGS